MVVSSRFPFASGLGLFDERATLSKLEGYLVGRQQQNNSTAQEETNIDDTLDDDDGSYDEPLPDEDDEREREEEEYEEESEDSSEYMEEELEDTQSKLNKTQSHLKQWDDQLQLLQRRLRSREKELNATKQEKNILIREVERLNAELDDKEKGPQASRRPELEQRLRKAVEYLQKDLSSAKEKYEACQIELRNHKTKMEYMEEKNNKLVKTVEELQSKDSIANDQKSNCQRQLAEAREEATRLTEEMVDLRERLRNATKIAEEKELMIEKNISNRVKEKIRLEVREETTQAVEERTEKRVRAEMQLAHEKEINILRAEFKKIFKENSFLKRMVEESRSGATRTEKLEHQIPVLKDEIERLNMELEATKDENEKVIADLETRYRNQIQAIKEQAAKEKWEHATEIRRQISKERDREVQDFTKRIEALSQQTDRLLQRAEREKEEYADQIRQRISEEKQREIQVMKNKLSEISKESEELLKEATKDKEAYADQIRKQMTDDRNREINKQSYRIEVLVGEKEVLLKRIEAFEQELAATWQEQEKNIEKITMMEAAVKSSEDENLRLKRTNQNLANLVERYSKENEDATAAFTQSKDHFRKSLLESEETVYKLKDQVQDLQIQLNETKLEKNELEKDLRATKNALEDSRRSEKRHLEALTKYRERDTDVNSETSSVNTMLSALESEKARLRGRRSGLVSIKNKHEILMKPRPVVSFESNGIPEDLRLDGERRVTEEERPDFTETKRLQRDLETSNKELELKNAELVGVRKALAEHQMENEQLTQTIGELNASLDACKMDLLHVKDELASAVEKGLAIPTLEADLREMRQGLENAREEAEIEARKMISESLGLYKQEIDSLREHLSQAYSRLQNCRCGSDSDVTTIDQSNHCLPGVGGEGEEEEDDTVESCETARLDKEIEKLKSMINLHQREFTEQQLKTNEEEASQSGVKDEETIAALESTIDTLQQEIDQRDAKLLELEALEKNQGLSIDHMTMKIQDLENLLSSTTETETSEELEHLKGENNILTEKVKELEMLLKEFNQRLSETSEELVESRQEVCIGGESISHLKLKVEKLTKILEEKEKRISEDEKTFEESKKRFDEHVENAHEEILKLQSEVEGLTFILKQTQNELKASRDQEDRARMYLQEELVQASNATKELLMEKIQLQEALSACRDENACTKDNLLELQRLFEEAELRSKEIVDTLQEEMERLSSELTTTQESYENAKEKIASADENLKTALQRSADDYEQRSKELQNSIDSLVNEKERLSEEYESLQVAFEKLTGEFEKEKETNEKELIELRNEVAACSKDNLEVSKELQHSRQLFREALIAWRVETKELTQQLNLLRGGDQWLSTGSNSKDSFSVQSSTQNIGDSEPVVESNSVEQTGHLENNFDNNRIPTVGYGMESPRGAQAYHFFNNLLVENNEEEEIMVGIYLQESAAQPSRNKNFDKDTDEFADTDTSVNTGGSGAPVTNDHPSTSQRRKYVRWSDKPEQSSSTSPSSYSPPSTKAQEKLKNKTDPKHDRVIETREECEERESIDGNGRVLLRKEDIHSTGNRIAGSFSTDEGSLRGSKLLPPREHSRTKFPVQSSQFQQFRRSQQQHLESSESRDDTVHSSDSTFFSYTYSSTSNYSSRDFGEYSQHCYVDTGNSHETSTHNTTTKGRPQQSRQHLIPDNDDNTVISGLSASSHPMPPVDRSFQRSSPRAWSPRYMELVSKQRSSGGSFLGKPPSPRGEVVPEPAIIAKPVPYDEQTEQQLEEERPFDEEHRKLLEQEQLGRRLHQQHQDEESASLSLADTSTLMNSEHGSLTVNTDRS
ncbi:chromosome assembly protein [Nitzschia inconspicua]|uniref:Chromosome assembly protein n=1 Tax=Nitzschia inconspicua TaxID=303405 RepID=A0A9K3KQH3_9STRA|nr:chromosome assembly protein [Nitzschia inconspicua]